VDNYDIIFMFGGDDMQFSKNIGAISAEDQKLLSEKCVAVLGCGGLGGYLIEYAARIGVGKIIAVDADVFSESNLNRQILCTHEQIGKKKVLAAKQRALSINPNLNFVAVDEFLTEENAMGILEGADLILDGLDNVRARLAAEDAAAKLGIPMVHGAISGWIVQACTAMPGEGFLAKLYSANQESSTENESTSETSSTLAFTPAICAGLQVSEAVKILTSKKPSLEGRLLIADLYDNAFNTVSFE